MPDCVAAAQIYFLLFILVFVFGSPPTVFFLNRISSLGGVTRKPFHPFSEWHGKFEQAVIFVLAALDFDKAIIFAVAWMGLKLASNWNRPESPGVTTSPIQSDKIWILRRQAKAERKAERKAKTLRARGALSALVGSTVSAGFAIVCARVAVFFAALAGCNSN